MAVFYIYIVEKIDFCEFLFLFYLYLLNKNVTQLTTTAGAIIYARINYKEIPRHSFFIIRHLMCAVYFACFKVFSCSVTFFVCFCCC